MIGYDIVKDMTKELDDILKRNRHPRIYDTLVGGVGRIRPDLLEFVQETPRHQPRQMITEAGVRELVDWADKQFDDMNQIGEAKTRHVREALNQWKTKQDGGSDTGGGFGEGGFLYHY